MCIDEVGYLTYDARAADLLFQVVTRRYEQKAIVATTNLAFRDWHTIFPNAACAVGLIDRLTHHAALVKITGDSYRLREAERAQKAQGRVTAGPVPSQARRVSSRITRFLTTANRPGEPQHMPRTIDRVEALPDITCRASHSAWSSVTPVRTSQPRLTPGPVQATPSKSRFHADTSTAAELKLGKNDCLKPRGAAQPDTPVTEQRASPSPRSYGGLPCQQT